MKTRDPRKRRGRRHSLAGLLAVGIAAVIAGSRSFAAIGQWAADAGLEALTALGAVRGPAEESTFRRAFALVSADVLDQVLGAWLWTRAAQASGRLVIAIDGKTVRGAKGKDRKAPHLVAALAHGIGAVLGQVAVDDKSNEIPAVRELLKAFADLTGVVVTIDAMHTQHDTAQLILGRGADYVMTVKANMPTLHKQLKKLPWTRIPSVSSVPKLKGGKSRSKAAWGVGPGRGGRFLATLLRKVARESPHDPALPTTEGPTPTSWEARPRRPEPGPGPPPLRVHPHRPRLNTPFAAPMAAPYRRPHHGSYLWWWGPGPLSKPPGGGGIRTLRPPLHVFAFAMARRCSSSCRSCARRIARSQLASLGGSFMGSC